MTDIIVGSSILGLENVRDRDILVLDSEREYSWFDLDKNNFHPVSYERLKNEMAFMPNRYWDGFYAYMLDSDINPNELDYNVFEHKDDMRKMLKEFNFERRGMVIPEKYAPKIEFLDKKYYHLAYNLFLLQNGSKELSQEQKDIIQKIHDREMPLSYKDILVHEIKNL